MRISNIFYWVFWKNFWYEQISTRLRPRNKWLTNVIPRSYRDIDFLVEAVCIACLKSYVENELEFKYDYLYPDMPENQIKLSKEVEQHYKLVTEKLPFLEGRLKAEWDNVPKFSFEKGDLNRKIDYNATYGGVDKLEIEIDELKTKVCLFVVKNRGSLWT